MMKIIHATVKDSATDDEYHDAITGVEGSGETLIGERDPADLMTIESATDEDDEYHDYLTIAEDFMETPTDEKGPECLDDSWELLSDTTDSRGTQIVLRDPVNPSLGIADLATNSESQRDTEYGDLDTYKMKSENVSDDTELEQGNGAVAPVNHMDFPNEESDSASNFDSSFNPIQGGLSANLFRAGGADSAPP